MNLLLVGDMKLKIGLVMQIAETPRFAALHLASRVRTVRKPLLCAMYTNGNMGYLVNSY